MTNSPPRLLIKNGTLIDGRGCEPVPNTLVVVEGNRIAHVGPTDGRLRPESPDDRVIDAAGKFILPGLIDAHCHISLHQGASGREIHFERRVLHLVGGACDRVGAARRGHQHRRPGWQMVHRCNGARSGRGRAHRRPADGRRRTGAQQLRRHL